MKDLKNCLLKFPVLIILLLFFISSPLYANDKAWEFWNANAVSVPISERLKFDLEKEFRYKNGEIYYDQTDLRFLNKFNSRISAGVGFQYNRSKKEGYWYEESRPFLIGRFGTRMGDFKIDNINRLEYRMYGDPREKDHYRYRTRLQVSYPIKSRMKFEPYLSNEFFVKLQDGNWTDISANRFYAGIKSVPLRNLEMDLFYLNRNSLRQVNDIDMWSDTNIIGLKLKYNF
jgi:hypothetical protein